MSMRFVLPAFVAAAVLGTVGYMSSPSLTSQAMADNSAASTTSSSTTDTTSLNNTAPAAGKLPSQIIVAEFGDQRVTKADVEALYEAIEARAGDQAPPMDDIFWMLADQIISSRLIVEEAKEQNLAGSPDVLRSIETAREQIIQEAYIRKLLANLESEETLRPYYDKFVASMEGEEEVHARHILVEDEQQAKNIITQLKEGASFVQLAKEHTQDPGSKESGGDLGFFHKEAMVPEFAEAAFALESGEMTEIPVQTQFGWHIIKVEERREREAPSFEEIKPQLKMEAQQEILQEHIEKLRSEADIKLFESEHLPPKNDSVLSTP